MATTIAPNSGAGVLLTQQGIGASPGYAALDFRRADSLGVLEGVYNASDFMVVQRAAGANLSVDIGMPAGGFACVQGDTINGQGIYSVPVHSTTINEAIATADGTNPRVDSVILEIQDNAHDSSGGNLAQTRVLTGTATAGATLATRAGAATLPASALLLADVLVPANALSVTNATIRDRRKWARGISYASVVSVSLGTATSFTTLSAYDRRIECSGVPMKVKLFGSVQENSVANTYVGHRLLVDGSAVGSDQYNTIPITGRSDGFGCDWAFVPSAGSHLLQIQYRISGGTPLYVANPSLVLEETIRQNAVNNSTTTG